MKYCSVGPDSKPSDFHAVGTPEQHTHTHTHSHTLTHMHTHTGTHTPLVGRCWSSGLSGDSQLCPCLRRLGAGQALTRQGTRGTPLGGCEPWGPVITVN